MIEHGRIILLRPSGAGYEILLVRRSGVTDVTELPGGGIHDGEDARVGAARSTFEDCGVLLARDTGQAETLEMPTFSSIRRRIREGQNATELLRLHGLTWSPDVLVPWSQWRTPSIEAVRTSTKVFIAELPGGMRTSFEKDERASEHWIRPSDAESLAYSHALSPMIIRTCWELGRHLSIKAVLEAARKRASEQHPILPRLATINDERFVLLPWDPEYERAGQGESLPLSYQPSWAIGPSRFVLEDRTWKHVAAPGSTRAE